MARIVDITDKLSFEGNPKLNVKGNELEVNADAPTMLKVMSLMDSGNAGAEEITGAFDLMFSEDAKIKIEKLKLNFKDLIIVVQEAVKLITGEENSQGEQ